VQLIAQLEPLAQTEVVALVKKLHPHPKTAQDYLDMAAKLVVPPASPASSK
jgi:hypothetical protein